MRAADIYLLQCADGELYVFSVDRTGCNLPRSLCHAGWVLRAQLKPADLVEAKYAALVHRTAERGFCVLDDVPRHWLGQADEQMPRSLGAGRADRVISNPTRVAHAAFRTRAHGQERSAGAGVPALPSRPRSSPMEKFSELFEETLKDIYYAEKAILKALPKMAKKSSSSKLEAAFTRHQKETERQVERLDEVFKLIGKRASGKDCPAIDGIIEEAEELMKEAKDDTIRDAAMVAAAQAVEHYEISRYGTLIAWADKMEMSDAAELLQQTLEEEKLTDQKLTELAESEINVEAEATEDEDADEEPPKRRASGGRRK